MFNEFYDDTLISNVPTYDIQEGTLCRVLAHRNWLLFKYEAYSFRSEWTIAIKNSKYKRIM